VVEPENAAADAALNELLERLGHVWPASDEQLDAWLRENPLSTDEAAWVRSVVRKRVDEARGAGSIQPPSLVHPRPIPSLAGEEGARRARRLSYDDLATLNGELLDLVEARVPLPTGLAAWTENLKAGRLAHVLDSLRTDLEQGRSLSEAMGRLGDALPPIYRALVAAGEASGDIESPLLLLSEQAEADADIARRVREALVYPVVTLTATIGIVGGVLVFVLPQFRPIFDGMSVELPAITTMTLGVAEAVHGNLLASCALVVALTGAAGLAFSRTGARLARRAIFKRTSPRRLAELARSLGGLLHRGVPADKAFRALSEAYGETFPKGALEGVVDSLDAGSSLGVALRQEKAFPPTFTWLVGTAEERGTLPETLADLASQYERAFRRRLKLVEAIVAPIALIVVGFFVAGAIFSVFLPIFKLQQGLMQ
jgi:general secretion pathway protein F